MNSIKTMDDIKNINDPVQELGLSSENVELIQQFRAELIKKFLNVPDEGYGTEEYNRKIGEEWIIQFAYKCIFVAQSKIDENKGDKDKNQ